MGLLISGRARSAEGRAMVCLAQSVFKSLDQLNIPLR